jgi:hypothetical protein
VAGVHLAYMVYVPLGGFLALRDRRWLWPHLTAAVWGVVGILTLVHCPATQLEKWLLVRAGRTPYDGTFIAHYLHGRVYPGSMQDLVWFLSAASALTSWALVARHQVSRGTPVREAPATDPVPSGR